MVDSFITVKSKENLETFYRIITTNLNPEYIYLIKTDYYFKILFDNRIAASATHMIADLLVRCYAVFFITCLAEEDFGEISDDEFYELIDYFAKKVAEEDFKVEIINTKDLLTYFINQHTEISIDGFFVFCLRRYQDRILELYNDYLINLFEKI